MSFFSKLWPKIEIFKVVCIIPVHRYLIILKKIKKYAQDTPKITYASINYMPLCVHMVNKILKYLQSPVF